MQSIIRVGSCGALTEKLAIRDIVIASGACTDSSMNRIRFEGLDYAPVADFGLLRAASTPQRPWPTGAEVHVGLIFSADSFYSPARADRPDGRARRARGRDGGERALHARRRARPQGAGGLHGLRPRRHRRGSYRQGAEAEPSARWSGRPRGGGQRELLTAPRLTAG